MAGKSTGADSNGNIEPIGLDGNTSSESGDDGTAAAIDPADIGSGDIERDEYGNVKLKRDGTPAKRRGRKPGGGGSGGSAGQPSAVNRASNNKTVIAGVETLSQTLLIFHMGLANFMRFKGMELEKSESDALAASLANVMAQFDFAPDPRFTAIAGLVTTGATIYGPRAYLYREEVKEKKAAKKAAVGDGLNVVDFSPGNLAG